MRLITENTVFNVSVSYSKPDPPPYEVPITLNLTNCVQESDTQEDQYLVRSALVEKLGVSITNPSHPLSPLLLKYRKRFRTNAIVRGRFLLTENDISKFQPADLAFIVTDITIARLLEVYFSILPHEFLKSSDLDHSMEVGEKDIIKRLEFFQDFDFVTIEGDDNPIIRAKLNTLNMLRDYINSYETDENFFKGTAEEFSGRVEISVPVALPFAVGTTAEGTTCETKMRDGERCGRATYSSGDTKCILHSTDAEKDVAEFDRTLHDIIWGENRYADLSYVIFPSGSRAFCQITTDKLLKLSGCTFLGDLVIRDCQIKDISFWQCNFHEGMFIEEARIENLAFHYTSHNATISFTDCHFYKVFSLTFMMFTKAGQEAGIWIFDRVTFHSECNPVLASVDMRYSTFSLTDLSNVKMYNVTWPETGTAFWKRSCLYDEQRVGSAADIYRGLQAAYRRTDDLSQANQFHVSEMEVKRQHSGSWRRYFSLNSMYKAASNYGQSIILPLLWAFLVVVPLFTLMMLLFGSIDGLVLSGNGDVLEFFRACAKNIIMLFNRSQVSIYVGDVWLNQLLNIVESGIVFILLSFVVIATRRKFKNRNR